MSTSSMCQEHMKRWCNNVDWSLESVFLNINNDVCDHLNRFGLLNKQAISYFGNSYL